MRVSTDRPEAVKAGFARIAGTSTQNILRGIHEILCGAFKPPNNSPFGDGRVAERIVDILAHELL